MTKLKAKLLCLLVVLLTTSCGFKLRGDYGLPSFIQEVQLTSQQKNAPLQRLLTQQLKASNTQVYNRLGLSNDIQQQIDVSLFLYQDELDRRLLSLFATGQVAEYELVYKVKYSMQFAQQEAQLVEFEITREYQDDPDAVLAKSRELDLILGEMRQQAANRIMRQLASSSYATLPSPLQTD